MIRTPRVGGWVGWLAGLCCMATMTVVSAPPPNNTGWFSDLTLKGYAPVAYFTDGKLYLNYNNDKKS